MTKHTPITPSGPAQRNPKRSSLFERADAAYGLDQMGGSAVPKDLPEVEKRVSDAVRRAAEAKQAKAHPQVPVQTQLPPPVPSAYTPAPEQAQPAQINAQPRPEPRVALSGPRVAIDRDVLRYESLIVPEDPVTGLLEEFRIIKREVLAEARASGDAEARRILVSSPHEGEGKTFCAANLAIALSAERDVEVLLVDADLMQPSITDRFGIETGPGLMDAITDRGQRPEELAVATDIERLFIMPAGSSSVRDSEYLASKRTGEVLDRLTRGAPNRFVIFDTPPALAASPAAELAAHVGQALLVARADETSRAALEDAQQLLSACPDIKLLLNAAQFSPSGRRFGEYVGREE